MDSRRRSTRAVDDKNSENTTVSRAFDNTDRNLTVSNEVEKEDVSFFFVVVPIELIWQLNGE